MLALVAALLVGCTSQSVAGDAAVACGWEETDEPLVLPAEATPDQLRQNVERAKRRLEAARRVVEVDDRFGPLVEALDETAQFAVRLRDMSPDEIEDIPVEDWDFAKYVQFVARDQCEQLAAVVSSE